MEMAASAARMGEYVRGKGFRTIIFCKQMRIYLIGYKISHAGKERNMYLECNAEKWQTSCIGR